MALPGLTPSSTGTVSGNVIVNTIAGVPAATFQSINKRLASPVAPGTLTVSVQPLQDSCLAGQSGRGRGRGP